jgi:hypothetical protein
MKQKEVKHRNREEEEEETEEVAKGDVAETGDVEVSNDFFFLPLFYTPARFD